MTDYCALSIWPCWSRGEWISLWSGIVGAAAAFALATAYQAILRHRDARIARRNWQNSLENLSRKLEPFYEGSVASDTWRATETDRRDAAFAITKARAALDWSVGHPEFFEFDQWADLQEARQILEIWFEHCNRSGGFAGALYQGELGNAEAISLARSMKALLELPQK